MRSEKNNWRCVVGLTGGMGSGKSLVLELLRKKGAFTLDADAIVHRLLANDRRILNNIREKFGPGVFRHDGTLDRRALARAAFASAGQKKKLERIIHPRVRETIFNELKRNKGDVAV